MTKKKDTNDDRTIDDARNIYLYDPDKLWTTAELGKSFDGVKGCSIATLRKYCAEENWPEQRKRFRKDVSREAREKFVDLASKKKSEQAVKNIGRLEVIISLLMQRFNDAESLLIKSDYDAARLLRYLIEAQSDIYDSVDSASLTGVKGHRFIIKMERDHNEDPLDENPQPDIPDT